MCLLFKSTSTKKTSCREMGGVKYYIIKNVYSEIGYCFILNTGY